MFLPGPGRLLWSPEHSGQVGLPGRQPGGVWGRTGWSPCGRREGGQKGAKQGQGVAAKGQWRRDTQAAGSPKNTSGRWVSMICDSLTWTYVFMM